MLLPFEFVGGLVSEYSSVAVSRVVRNWRMMCRDGVLSCGERVDLLLAGLPAAELDKVTTVKRSRRREVGLRWCG